MAVGRTPKLAWGVTYMHADTSDFFMEDCRPGGATGWQYRRGEQWLDWQHRREVVKRRGAEPTLLDVYENEQGVLTCTPDSGAGKYLSAAWVGAEFGARSRDR